MRRRIIIALALIAAAIMSAIGGGTVAHAGQVNMGAGIICVGTPPVYGVNPRISCQRTATRYAYRWYQAPIGGGQCRHWAQYGSAAKWSNGTYSFLTSSQTFLYQGSCF